MCSVYVSVINGPNGGHFETHIPGSEYLEGIDSIRLPEWKTKDIHPLRVRPGLCHSIRILTVEHDLTTLKQQEGVKKGGLCFRGLATDEPNSAHFWAPRACQLTTRFTAVHM